MTARQTRPGDAQIVIAELGLANSLRILATRRLRAAGAIHCKRTTRVARWLWRRRIVPIPDHSYTPVADGYFFSVLNDRLIEIMEGAFDEADRYVRRFLELRLAIDVTGSVSLLLDHEILAPSLGRYTFLLVPRSPFLHAIRCRYEQEGLEIGWCFSGVGLRSTVRPLGAACAKTVRAAVHWLCRGRVTPGGERTAPMVSVLCHDGGESLSLRSGLFWLAPGRNYPNVIVERGTTHRAISDAMVAELQQRGVTFVETHGRKRRNNRSLYWQPGPIFLRGFVRSAACLAWRLLRERKTSLRVRWWRFVQELTFNLFLHQRLDYCTTFNVKAEMRLGTEPFEPAYSSALAQLGGITVTQQVSVSIFYSGATSTSTVHLYFGRRYSSEIKSPLLSDFSLMNGYVFKSGILASQEIVRELRSTLACAGVLRSVCFLEENPVEEFKDRLLFPVYRFLMEKVLEDPQFGVLIKPKKGPTVAVLEKAMGPLFDRARRTGRFIVLDRYHYPGVVAQAVDLATGVLGTGTLEAVVTGQRTVHLNWRGALPSFFCGAEPNIYETVEGFTTAIETVLQQGPGCNIGRHSTDFLQGVDHYGDGLAGERMEHIALEYVSALGKGAAPQQALEQTMAGFDSRWGLCELRPSRADELEDKDTTRRSRTAVHDAHPAPATP